MLAELDTCSAAGDEGWAVVEVVNAADVAAVAKEGMIEQAAAVGLFAGFESVERMVLTEFPFITCFFLEGFCFARVAH